MPLDSFDELLLCCFLSPLPLPIPTLSPPLLLPAPPLSTLLYSSLHPLLFPQLCVTAEEVVKKKKKKDKRKSQEAVELTVSEQDSSQVQQVHLACVQTGLNWPTSTAATCNIISVILSH